MTYEPAAADLRALARAQLALLEATLREFIKTLPLEQQCAVSVQFNELRKAIETREERIEREYVDRPSGKIINLGMRRRP